MGMDTPLPRSLPLVRNPPLRTRSKGSVRPVVRRVCLCRYFHGACHYQERPGWVCHGVEQLRREQQHGNHRQFERATNGYNFAYWSVNGERQAAVTGVSANKVSLDVNTTTNIIAHYIPARKTVMGTGGGLVRTYNFGDLNETARMIRTGMGTPLPRSLPLVRNPPLRTRSNGAECPVGCPTVSFISSNRTAHPPT